METLQNWASIQSNLESCSLVVVAVVLVLVLVAGFYSLMGDVCVMLVFNCDMHISDSPLRLHSEPRYALTYFHFPHTAWLNISMFLLEVEINAKKFNFLSCFGFVLVDVIYSGFLCSLELEFSISQFG